MLDELDLQSLYIVVIPIEVVVAHTLESMRMIL